MSPSQRAITSLSAAVRQCINRNINSGWFLLRRTGPDAGTPLARHACRHFIPSASFSTDAYAGKVQEQRKAESGPQTNALSSLENANQARVQQLWCTALAQAVGAEAVAGGGASLRDLLQAAVRIRRGRPASILPHQLAGGLMAFYQQQLDPEGQRHFFHLLTSTFGIQGEEINVAVAGWQSCTLDVSNTATLAAARRLSSASQPLYHHLFVPLSQQPGGIKFLVDMRADVRALLQEQPSDAAPLRELDDALRGMLQEWFSMGLLELQRVTWGGSSGALLQKIMRYEAVEPMLGWQDLEQRLYPNRRVHAFFHPAMSNEPLVILHAALRQGVASTVAEVLDENREGSAADAAKALQSATAAVFYSVSSTQKGLLGVDLGHSLIEQVAHKLLRELPNLQYLATLSPLPGFRTWLETRLNQEMDKEWSLEPILLPSEVEQLQQALGTEEPQTAAHLLRAHLQYAIMREQEPEVEDVIKPILMRLAAHYLLIERRRGKALDQVANFHLRNGASVWRLNWMADPSLRGIEESFGIRVNYRYELHRLLNNNRQYVVDSKIAASSSVLQALQADPTCDSDQWVVQPSPGAE